MSVRSMSVRSMSVRSKSPQGGVRGHWFARFPADAFSAASVTRRWRVGAVLACAIHPRIARRAILGWIVQARTAPTRARRVAEAAEKAAVGKRANEWPRTST